MTAESFLKANDFLTGRDAFEIVLKHMVDKSIDLADVCDRRDDLRNENATLLKDLKEAQQRAMAAELALEMHHGSLRARYNLFVAAEHALDLLCDRRRGLRPLKQRWDDLEHKLRCALDAGSALGFDGNPPPSER